MDLRHSINSFSCLFSVSDGVLLSSATKVPKNAAKNYVFGFPRRDMVVMCSLLRTSRNRYLRTRTLSRIVLLLFPQASRCCLYREAAFLFYRLAARRCRADGTSNTPSPTGGLSRPLRRAGPMCPAARYACFPAGHAGPALQQGSAVIQGEQSRPPLIAICSSAHTAGSAPPAG